MPINPELYQRQARYLSYLLNDFILWHLVRVRERFDGDLDSALILGEIAHYNLQKNFRKIFSQDQVAVGHEPVRNLLKSTNTLSISAATGIPRETVRRKIQWLEERGWITKDSKGALIVTSSPAEDFKDFNFEALERFMATAGKLHRIVGQESAGNEELIPEK